MITLYHSPFARSGRVVWMLEEMGLTYDLKILSFPEGLQTEEFGKIAPLRCVPVFLDGDLKLIESAAICTYLAETYCDGAFDVPRDHADRPLYHQWMHFTETAMAPVADVFAHTLFLPEDQRDPDLRDKGIEKGRKLMQFIESFMEGRRYLVAEKFTAADACVGYSIGAAKMLGVLDETTPLLNAYADRVLASPGMQKATAP